MGCPEREHNNKGKAEAALKNANFRVRIDENDGVKENIERDVGLYLSLHVQTFIAGFTAAGETTSPPMERSQGHSQTRISIIFFIPQKKKRLKEREREGGGDGLEGSSKREAVCMGVWGRGAEEGNHRRIMSEGLCVSVKLFSLGNRYIDLLTLSPSVRASCLCLPCRTPHPLQAK